MKTPHLSILAIMMVFGYSLANNPNVSIDLSNENCAQELAVGGTPFIVTCNDTTLEVQSDLTVPLRVYDISDAPKNFLYAVDAFAGGTTNIHLYDYDALTNDISVLDGAAGSTGSASQFYGIDYHPIENQVYILNDDPGGVRSLFLLDMAMGLPAYINAMVSPLGDTQPQDLTFDGDGNLYVTFRSGEIGLYDFGTGTMLPFADLGAAGAAGGVGLTYDWDNDRLLHASGTGTVTVNAIDIATAAISVVTTFVVPDGGCGGTAQGLEYVGNNKAVGSTTFGCDVIYWVDLIGGTATLLTNPFSDGFTTSIKDLMYINFDVVLDPATLDCANEGVNTVSVTVTDYNGSVSTCDATVTVTDPNGYCVASVDDFKNNQFVMYPNPAGDSFQIEWNGNTLIIGVQVFDILGKSVLIVDNIQAENPVIDVAGLSPGVYIVKLESELGSSTARLIKQ